MKYWVAEDIQEKGDTTSRIAKKNNAVAAINGGGFYDPNGTGTGRLPYGFIIHEGKYLLGQQVDDKERVDFVGMTRSGNLIAGNYNKKELHDLGRSDDWIAKHLGMDADEILRLKQITGLAELFANEEFSEAWEDTE